MTTGLTFTPSTHKYRLDGKPVAGVTTLLGKGIPKPALVYWSAKTVAEWVADNPEGVENLRAMGRGPMVQALKSTPWEARDKAAVRGTDVHTLAEELVHGREVEVPEHLAAYVDGYVRWLDAEQPEPLWTERAVASRKWRYAGTFDLIATLRGETWLLDVKTAKGVYGDNALQVAAYARAEFLVDGEDEVPMPEIHRLGVLHVTEAGTELRPIKAEAPFDAPFNDFLHAAWMAKGADRIKDYIGAALPADHDDNEGSAA